MLDIKTYKNIRTVKHDNDNRPNTKDSVYFAVTGSMAQPLRESSPGSLGKHNTTRGRRPLHQADRLEHVWQPVMGMSLTIFSLTNLFN